MKSKKILKFYFRAERLNTALDNIITGIACASAGRSAESCANKLIECVFRKRLLCELWAYLNGVMASFAAEEVEVLRGYALSQRGYSGLERSTANAIRRVVVRFMRRAWRLHSFESAVELVGRYYALLGR